MSSGKGGNLFPGTSGASKGKGIVDPSSLDADQLSQDVSEMNLDGGQDEGWKVQARKSKNKPGTGVKKLLVPLHSNPPKAWGQSDTAQKLGMQTHRGAGGGPTQNPQNPAGRGNVRPQPSQPAPVMPPGFDWSTLAASNQSTEGVGHKRNVQKVNHLKIQAAKVEDNDDDDAEDDDELDFDSSDNEFLSDDYDSDKSQKSHETRKKNKWFSDLFVALDSLSAEQISNQERRWHCPACKGGPGEIDWYHGLQPLISHARTKRSRRVKLHRELAELLDEELRIRGTSVIPFGEMYGKWKGLEQIPDKEIVWPPMVMVMNTRHEKDENDKWIGMGNQELLDYFSSYAAAKARHSYGPQGHRGISVLIFEASAVGYAEAERLGKHFEDTCRDRVAWDRNRVLFYAGGQRQLYGFMAEKRDLDDFNKHSPGKSKLKYDMKSYQEMVVKQLQQMSEDNQQLVWLRNKVAREQRDKKALEESYGLLSEKLRKTMEENKIVRLRTKTHHEQNKDEMDFQENFFKGQIQQIYDARNAKEEDFEKSQQEQREKLTLSAANVSSVEDRQRRMTELAKFIQLQDEEMKEFAAERDKLVNEHEEKMMKLRQKYLDEKVAVEKEFDAGFNMLLEKYSPKQ